MSLTDVSARVAPGGLPPTEHVTIHGHRRAFRRAGRGPALVLVHGIGDRSDTWSEVIGELARDHLVIAPDLLGHGASDAPRGDYSIGGFANGLRDLLSVLDVERATVVGHSLGAGVASQFAYQYPERCERLVLVGAGGVDHTVHPWLRLAALPGAATAMAALHVGPVDLAVRTGLGVLRRLGTPTGLDAADLLRVLEGLPDASARAAFVRTLRAVIDPRGQVVTMLDRCYLAEGMPTLLVWGTRDAVVPVEHAHLAHRAMPGSRLELFRGAGHFPFRTDPERFVDVLREFLATTAPATHDVDAWRERLRRGAPDPPRRTVARLVPPTRARAGARAR